MTNWYESSIKALQLNGKGERTQECHSRAVPMLTEFYAKPPDLIDEEELQDYFLHRKDVNKSSPNTMRICYCGIRSFYENVLKRNWHILGILRAQNERRLPAVLSQEEVRRLLACVKTPQNHAFLTTVYSCGLRLQEAMHLEVSDIDSAPDRMMIHVHRGKGAKDRYVPLPHATLDLLRRYWVTHRNPRLLFPAMGRNAKGEKDAQTPMVKSSVQGAFRGAKLQAGIPKRNVCVHTLRHSFASHLLQANCGIICGNLFTKFHCRQSHPMVQALLLFRRETARLSDGCRSCGTTPQMGCESRTNVDFHARSICRNPIGNTGFIIPEGYKPLAGGEAAMLLT